MKNRPTVSRHKKVSWLSRMVRWWPLALTVLAVLTVGALHVWAAMSPRPSTQSTAVAVKTQSARAVQPISRLQSVPVAATVPPKPAVPATSCATSTLSQNIVVSISRRHLWACDGTTISYNSPVVTGMANLAADLTPTGIYHIYGKQTDLYLKGSDSTGSWNDYVNYWMPFLDNQYGAYGFHDATWRADGAFGNISPDSSDASHGCVELPLATAKWLFDWASIGTTVTIVS